MEQWEIDFNWLKIQHFVKNKLSSQTLPKLDSVLFVIGLQETGLIKEEYSKEEKLGITSAGTLAVLSLKDYFRRTGTDDDGWPLWEVIKPYEPVNELERNNELKMLINSYFEQRYDISDTDNSN